jgi:transposase-like protein
MRNAFAHAAPKQRPAVIAMIKTVFAQETAEAARQQWDQVTDALREKFPKLADMMDASREDVLAYMTSPRIIGRRSPPRIHWKGSTRRSSEGQT